MDIGMGMGMGSDMGTGMGTGTMVKSDFSRNFFSYSFLSHILNQEYYILFF